MGGDIMIGSISPAYKLDVTGDIRATSEVYGAVKCFDIAHESKECYHLRYWCTEGDVTGGSLIYKRLVTTVKAGLVNIIMPSWFEWLAKNVMTFCNGYKHHGIG